MTALAPSRESAAALDFALSPDLEASEPPEARGRGRDDVRLLVSRAEAPPVHACIRDLAEHLEPGDLLVVNTSATLAASLDAVSATGAPLEVHLSAQLTAGLWLVELRAPAAPASLPHTEDEAGAELRLPGGATMEILSRYRGSRRLWLALLRTAGLPVGEYLARNGRPIRYRHVPVDWPLSSYQTVFAREPGSAEMPSAARPLTGEILADLVARGVALSPVVLHAGVSSAEGSEAPHPERFSVPGVTAERVNSTRSSGGRVIAAGTTVVRALESAVDGSGLLRERRGWTEVVVTPERGVEAVDGILTGWHEPRASHLLMLEAIAGRRVLETAYRAAVDARYRWHEFGDAHLILPATTRSER